MPFGRVFETLAWGRRHVVMGANQVDRYGNQNLSAFRTAATPHPADVRRPRCPGNTINHATSYWVGKSLQAVPAHVDIVSGIGWDKRSGQPGLPVRRCVPGGPGNLGVFDFGGLTTMRALSLHPGWNPTKSRTPPSRCTD